MATWTVVLGAAAVVWGLIGLLWADRTGRSRDDLGEVLAELADSLESLAHTARSASAAPKPSLDPEVVALARAGMGAGEIARRLQRPQGEVELVLSLARLAGTLPGEREGMGKGAEG